MFRRAVASVVVASMLMVAGNAMAKDDQGMAGGNAGSGFSGTVAAQPAAQAMQSQVAKDTAKLLEQANKGTVANNLMKSHYDMRLAEQNLRNAQATERLLRAQTRNANLDTILKGAAIGGGVAYAVKTVYEWAKPGVQPTPVSQ